MDGARYPSYLPSSTVALVLLTIGYDYKPGEKGAPGQTSVKERWRCHPQQLLEGLRMDATSLGPIQTRIEKWFDLSIEHLSGKFKRITQLWTMVIALAIVAAANIDTLAIASYLYRAPFRTATWPCHDRHACVHSPDVAKSGSRILSDLLTQSG
jgi:hypothetical protein